jgi:hypothetical protein
MIAEPASTVDQRGSSERTCSAPAGSSVSKRPAASLRNGAGAAPRSKRSATSPRRRPVSSSTSPERIRARGGAIGAAAPIAGRATSPATRSPAAAGASISAPRLGSASSRAAAAGVASSCAVLGAGALEGSRRNTHSATTAAAHAAAIPIEVEVFTRAAPRPTGPGIPDRTSGASASAHARPSPPRSSSRRRRSFASPRWIRLCTVATGAPARRAISRGGSSSKNRHRIVVRYGSSRSSTACTRSRCTAARSIIASVDGSASARAELASRRARLALSRRVSAARRRRIVASQPRRGGSGRGPCSSAATHVSCTRSSAALASTTSVRASARIQRWWATSSAASGTRFMAPEMEMERPPDPMQRVAGIRSRRGKSTLSSLSSQAVGHGPIPTAGTPAHEALLRFPWAAPPSGR